MTNEYDNVSTAKLIRLIEENQRKVNHIVTILKIAYNPTATSAKLEKLLDAIVLELTTLEKRPNFPRDLKLRINHIRHDMYKNNI